MTQSEEASLRMNFCSEVARILDATSPDFDLDEIAKCGQEMGVISPKEAEQILLYSRFPRWIQEGISSLELTDTGRYSKETLSKSSSISLSAPRAKSVVSSMTDSFVSSKALSSDMFTIRGGKAIHRVRNFSKLSWTEGGVVAPMSDLDGQMYKRFIRDSDAVHLPGNTFIGVVEGSVVYTHWLLDTLPRLLMLQDAGVDLNTFDNFLFATTAHGFHKQVLQRLDISPDKVFTRQRQGTLFSTEEFTYVSPPRHNFLTNPKNYDMVGSFFGQPRLKKTGKRKIFVSRSKASRRRILNEEDVMAYLRPKGYEQVCFEDLSIRETAELIAQASEIIAPHGAGLANLVFARPGTKVLEMFNAHLSKEYWIISSQLNLSYYAFETAGPDGNHLDTKECETMPFLKRNGLDMVIQMDKFRDFFDTTFQKETI